MAETHAPRLTELSLRAASTRKSLSDAGKSLVASGNVNRRIQTSIRGNLTIWLGSAALVGLILAKLPARKNKVYVNSNTGVEKKAKSGIIVALLGFGFQLARPVLQKFLVEQIKAYSEKTEAKTAKPATIRPTGNRM